MASGAAPGGAPPAKNIYCIQALSMRGKDKKVQYFFNVMLLYTHQGSTDSKSSSSVASCLPYVM